MASAHLVVYLLSLLLLLFLFTADAVVMVVEVKAVGNYNFQNVQGRKKSKYEEKRETLLKEDCKLILGRGRRS